MPVLRLPLCTSFLILASGCTSASPDKSAVPASPSGGGEIVEASGGNMNTSGGSSGGAVNQPGSGGESNATGGAKAGSGVELSACDADALVWKTARKSNYESYPEPGSDECVIYNGCQWAGWFAGCEDQKSEEWVASHNIAAFFPGFDDYKLHDICIRSGDKTMIVTAFDTCGDDDCDGCCTRNQGSEDALIDLESSTNERWGLPDGSITWADLGPTTGNGCE